MNWSHIPTPTPSVDVPRDGTFWDALPPEFKYVTFNDHGFATAHTHKPTKAVIKGTGSANKDGAPEVLGTRWNSAGKQQPMGMCEIPSGSNLSHQVLVREGAEAPAPTPRTEAVTPGMVEKAPMVPGATPDTDVKYEFPKAVPVVEAIRVAAGLPEGAKLTVHLQDESPEEVRSDTPATVGNLATLTEVVAQLVEAVELLVTLDNLANESGARRIIKDAIGRKLIDVRKALGE